MDRIEDEIFVDALEASGIVRTKSMYQKAQLPHTCEMCNDENKDNKIGFKLRRAYVSSLETPYKFICEECFNELKE